MTDEELARMVKFTAEQVRRIGGFTIVAVVAVSADGAHLYGMTSPDCSHKVFEALLRKALEVPVQEVEVSRDDEPNASPPTVWSSMTLMADATHGCTRKLGHPGLHRNRIAEWSDVVEPRLRSPGRTKPDRRL